MNKEKKLEKPRQSSSKPLQKPKTPKDQKKKVVIQDMHIEEPEIHIDHEQKLETLNEHQEELINENDHKQDLELEDQHEEKLETSNHEELINEHEQNLELENKDEQQLETQNDEYEQLNDIEQSDSSHHDNKEQIEEKNENEMSADELDENNETSINISEDEIKRPESISITNGYNEPFIESNTSSPIEELKSQLSPHDPMTTGFVVDDDPNTENPFIEKTDDTDEDDIEIIHHDVSTSNKHPMPSIEEIDPQGLPIENHFHSNKISNNKSNR